MLTYVLPLRWASDDGLDELTAYLRWLAPRVQLVVVDGSDPEIFAGHAQAWGGLGTHVAPDPDLRFVNGKVNGVHSGVRRAAHEAIVIADDDVRYDADGLARIEELLGTCDLVRPQNHFDPAPWHALWDTGRTLLNRAFGGDWPGTLGVRRSAFERAGGYDGDVLFENLELVRTIEASGGRVHPALDLLVRRRPPSVRTFWSQRVRQAYDEMARPGLLVLWLSVLPVLGAMIAAGWWLAIAATALALVEIAEGGRRRDGGRAVFPARATLFAPLWVLERGACAWLAVWARLVTGGVRYRGTVVRRAASSRRVLAERFASSGRRQTDDDEGHVVADRIVLERDDVVDQPAREVLHRS